jgi:adenine phosphoribosyltransferase
VRNRHSMTLREAGTTGVEKTFPRNRCGSTPRCRPGTLHRMHDDVEQARSALLRFFTWSGGHADFAAVLRDATFLRCVGPALAQPFRGDDVSAVVVPEARAFVFGTLAAHSLGVGLVLARKPDAVHPNSAAQRADAPDWRGRRVEFRISRGAVGSGQRLLLVDDWIETGSQARTIRALVQQFGAEIVGVSAVIDDAPDRVRRDLNVVGLLPRQALSDRM